MRLFRSQFEQLESDIVRIHGEEEGRRVIAETLDPYRHDLVRFLRHSRLREAEGLHPLFVFSDAAAAAIDEIEETGVDFGLDFIVAEVEDAGDEEYHVALVNETSLGLEFIWKFPKECRATAERPALIYTLPEFLEMVGF